MMRQFDHQVTRHGRLLFLVNLDEWDYFWGFRRFIKELHVP